MDLAARLALVAGLTCGGCAIPGMGRGGGSRMDESTAGRTAPRGGLGRFMPWNATAKRDAATEGAMRTRLAPPIQEDAGPRGSDPAYRTAWTAGVRKVSAETSDFAPIDQLPGQVVMEGGPANGLIGEATGVIDGVVDGVFGSDCGPGGCKPGHGAKAAEKRQFEGLGLKLPHAAAKRKNRRDIATNNPRFPRELRMSSHPLYVVEPPDVLYVEVANVPVDPEQDDIAPINGERLVRQDGTISLGFFGQIHVAGLTLQEIEQKIRRRLDEVSGYTAAMVYVDVASFNSKTYYVLGQVQQIGRLPVTGKETVLDAIVLAGGPTNFANLKDIHIARPNPGGGCDQILWVDYRAITECGDTRTNYQVLPGDRIVVPGTKGFRTNVFFDNFLSPFERIASLAALIRLSFNQNNN
jgi:polysaccharide export outer membrane protein